MEVIALGLEKLIGIMQWTVDNYQTIGAGLFVISSFLATTFKKNEVITRAMMDVERANKKYMVSHGKDLPDMVKLELAYKKIREYFERKVPFWLRPIAGFMFNFYLNYDKVKSEIDKYILERKKEAELLEADIKIKVSN